MKYTFDFGKTIFGIGLKEEISIKNIALIFVLTISSVLINFSGSILVEKISFPLYLDSIMTLFVTASFGLVPGLLCAVGSNMMLTIFVQSSPFFMICHICTVIFAWFTFLYAARKENHKNVFEIHWFLWAALWSAISNAIIGNIIVDIVFKSVTGRFQADYVVQGIFSAIPNRIFATYFGGMVENLADKMISACVSYGIYIFVNKKLSNLFYQSGSSMNKY